MRYFARLRAAVACLKGDGVVHNVDLREGPAALNLAPGGRVHVSDLRLL